MFLHQNLQKGTVVWRVLGYVFFNEWLERSDFAFTFESLLPGNPQNWSSPIWLCPMGEQSEKLFKKKKKHACSCQNALVKVSPGCVVFQYFPVGEPPLCPKTHGGKQLFPPSGILRRSFFGKSRKRQEDEPSSRAVRKPEQKSLVSGRFSSGPKL